MRRIEKITGRSDDMLIIRGVNLFPTQIEEILVSMKGLSPHYQLELLKKGNMDSVKVHCERTASATPDEASKAAHILAKTIKNTIGVTVEPVLHEPEGVPRSEGKAQRVIDNR